MPYNLRDRPAPPPKPPSGGPPPPPARRPHMAGGPVAPDTAQGDAEDAVVAKDAEVGDAQLDKLGSDAPKPAAAIPMAIITNFVKTLNDAVSFLSDGKVPPVAVDMPERASLWSNPLPAPVFGMLKLVAQIVEMSDEGGKFAAMKFDPVEAASSAEGLRDVTGKLGMMARDQELKVAVSKQRPVPDDETVPEDDEAAEGEVDMPAPKADVTGPMS